MYFLYFLYSKKKNNVYVGCTLNLKKRIEQHNKGLVKSTKNRKPYSLSYVRKREDYLKSLYGSRERKRIIKEYFDNKNFK